MTDCFCNVMPYTSYSEKLPGPGCRILFRTLVLTFCLCLLSGFEVRAQSAQRKFVVRGHVTDEAGTPLVGVTVVEHGTSNGVATLSGGEFSIGVAPGAVLDVSCVGYVPRSVSTENRTGLDITLEEAEQNGKIRELSTSARDVVEEYLTVNQHLSREVEGRLVVED